MLPDGAVKLKLYVPEPHFANVAVGALLDRWRQVRTLAGRGGRA